MKLRVFIGSSSESLGLAEAIRDGIRAKVSCTVWSDSFFKLSHTTIDTLSSQLDNFDAGIFVFGQDDIVLSREVEYSSPRDNVVFEHGLFCGHLGPKRSFVVRPRTKTLKWLSDLLGFTPAYYNESLEKSDPRIATSAKN